jgi:hypothetical protein
MPLARWSVVAVGGDGDPACRDPVEQVVLMNRFGGQHLLHLFEDDALPGRRPSG